MRNCQQLRTIQQHQRKNHQGKQQEWQLGTQLCWGSQSKELCNFHRGIEEEESWGKMQPWCKHQWKQHKLHQDKGWGLTKGRWWQWSNALGRLHCHWGKKCSFHLGKRRQNKRGEQRIDKWKQRNWNRHI